MGLGFLKPTKQTLKKGFIKWFIWGISDMKGYLLGVLMIRGSYYFGGSILGVPPCS